MDQVLSWDKEKFRPDSMDQVLSWDREKTYVASPVWIIESLVFTPLRSHLGDKTLALGNPFFTQCSGRDNVLFTSKKFSTTLLIFNFGLIDVKQTQQESGVSQLSAEKTDPFYL